LEKRRELPSWNQYPLIGKIPKGISPPFPKTGIFGKKELKPP